MVKKYKNVVLIPARGGSKSIPLKNIKEIAGQPLIYWSLDASVNCDNVDKVYVSTDSDEIKNVVLNYNKKNKDKIVVIDRSDDVSQDTSSTESVMLEFANRVDFQNIILIQCTSPLITTKDIDGCLEKFKNHDSVLSTVVQKRFYWQYNKDGSVSEVCHDTTKRPRRQDWDGLLAENGAIYIISKKNLLKFKCRLCGRIGTYEMAPETYFEIDEPSDWIIIEEFLNRRSKENGRARIK